MARSFKTVGQLAGQAEESIRRGKRQTTTATEREAAKQLKAQAALAKAAESLDRQRARGLHQVFRQQEVAAERAAKAQEQASKRAQEKIRRELEKTARAAEQAIAREQRAQLRNAKRGGESFARRTSHRATRFLMPEAPIGSMAMRGLGGVSRGLGIDASIQGAVGRVVSLEQQATDLSNSGYQAGAEGPNGRRVDPKALIAQARDAGGNLGIDAGEALEGLAQFQKIAGDLNTGREMLASMALLSKATGSSLAQMAAATANVSNGLGDIPNKAAVIDDVMRTIAGQGKLGAVEISDMAVQMARVAASAGKFSGNAGDNIKKMGALVQMARAQGGAPSAAEAARSVGGFAATMQKGARINAFKDKGIDVFQEGSGGTKLKDPIALIKESLKATGGNLLEMNKLFMDVVGARAVSGLQKEYVSAGGGDAGLEKVDAAINRLLRAQLQQKEIDESGSRAGSTAAAKAARFQNQLDQVTEKLMVDLVPALEQAGPPLLKFAETVGSVATWAVNNPKMAIGSAIAASIARAGIESTLRAGIERLIVGRQGQRAPAVGKVAGAVGAAGAGLSLAIAAATITTMVVESFLAKKVANEEERVSTSVGAFELEKKAAKAAEEGRLEEAASLLERAAVGRKQVIGNIEEDQGSVSRGFSELLYRLRGEGGDVDADQQDLQTKLQLQQKALESTTQLLGEIRNQLANGLNINNMPEGELPGRVDQE